MKCQRKSGVFEVKVFELGMEDGFRCYEDGKKPPLCNDSCNSCVLDGSTKPFINTHRGNELVNEGDYIVIHEDGTKAIYGPDVFENNFDILPEEDSNKKGTRNNKNKDQSNGEAAENSNENGQV